MINNMNEKWTVILEVCNKGINTINHCKFIELPEYYMSIEECNKRKDKIKIDSFWYNLYVVGHTCKCRDEWSIIDDY